MIHDQFTFELEDGETNPVQAMARVLQSRGYHIRQDTLDDLKAPKPWYVSNHQLVCQVMNDAGITFWQVTKHPQYRDRYWIEVGPPANIRFMESFRAIYREAMEKLPDPREPFFQETLEAFEGHHFKKVYFKVLENETERPKVAWEWTINGRDTGILFKEFYA